MSGEISRPYDGTRICKCQHFRFVHTDKGRCEAEGCHCTQFAEIDFDESEFGQAFNAWASEVLVTAKTAEDNFAAAFRYALDQGHINFGMGNFRGWQDDCNCASCRSQRIIFDYLWPVDAQPNKPTQR